MEVKSAPGEGTAFTIYLPMWAGPEGRAEEARGGRQARRAKLLVVEDDEGVCELLARLLGKTHRVEQAMDGRTAMEVFAPGRYDVAIIDIGMPGISGDRVAREMRQADPLIATVLITGWNLPESEPRVSVFDFKMQKPFDDLEAVQNIVARAIELRDRRAERKEEVIAHGCRGNR